MSKFIFRNSLIIGLFTLSGCTSLKTGEKLVHVTGNTKQQCVLHFIPEHSSLYNKSNIRYIYGDFSEAFETVSYEDNYIIEVTCAGKLVLTRVVNYPSQRDQFKLGNLN